MTAARVELLERRSLLAAVTPVPTFGQNGVLAPSPAPTTETAESIDLAGVTAGGILVDQYSDQIDHNVIHRFTLNGKEDSTFTATALPIFDTTAKYTADAQGRAIYAYANNTASGIFVGRVKVNGGIDSGFGVNGQATVTVPTAAGEVQTGRSIDAVSAAPDGSIYVAVTVASQSTNGAISSKRRYVYKLTAAGVLDTSFGRLAFSGVRKNFFLSATPDNGVMAGYKLAASIYSLIKLTRTGQADSAFGDGGVSNVLEVNAAAYFTAAIDAQGRPIVTASTALGASIYRLTAGGQIDNTFGENGIVSGLGRNSTIKALLPQADGTLIAQVVLGVKSVLVKFRATGEPDRTFDTDGVLDIHDGDTVSPVVAALPGNQFLSFASFPIGSGYTLQKLAVVVGGHNVTLNSNGTLQFVGDTADDKVVVSLTTPDNSTNHFVHVVANNVAFDFDYTKVKRISVALGQGDNDFQSSVHVRTTVIAGNGDDRIVTGEKDDEIHTGNGADIVYTRSGVDSVYFGAGDKYVDLASGGGRAWSENVNFGSDGDVTIVAGTGGGVDFRVTAASAHVRARSDAAFVSLATTAASAIDLSEVGSGATVYGSSGDDTIYGSNGRDLLYGGGGRDKIYGFNGNDRLYGQAGGDYLIGGAGADVLDGGANTDRAITDDRDTLRSIELS